MISWLRVVLPPWWAVVTVLLGYAAIEVFILAMAWYIGVPPYAEPFKGFGYAAIMTMAAIAYAAYRVWAFHPSHRPGYHEWLAGTPWTSQKPLPLGPVHLVFQDLVILGVMIALSWPRASITSIFLVYGFLVVYLGMLTIAHLYTGQKTWAYAVAFGLGLMVFVLKDPWQFFTAAAVTYGLAFLGLRASLARFPWEDVPLLLELQRTLKTNPFSRQDLDKNNRAQGWPFARLGPGFLNPPQISVADALGSGILVGWWFFVLAYHLNTEGDTTGIVMISTGFLLFGVTGRLVLYCNGYVPPLSLLGRLAHGQLIIPGYDQVFVAPLLATLVILAARWAPGWIEVYPIVAHPVGMVIAWWLLFGMGPDLHAWRLTGNHRIVKGLMNIGQTTR